MRPKAPAREVFNTFSFNKLRVRRATGVTVTETVGAAASLACTVRRSCSPFSASKVSLLLVTRHFFTFSCTAKSLAAQLHFIVAHFRRNSDGLDVFLTQIKALDELFQQILYLSIEVDFKCNSRIVFSFDSRFFRNRKMQVLI